MPILQEHHHCLALQCCHRRAGSPNPHARLPPGMLYASTPRAAPLSSVTAPAVTLTHALILLVCCMLLLQNLALQRYHRWSANTPRASPLSCVTAPSPPGWPLPPSHMPSSRYVVCQYSKSIATVLRYSAVTAELVAATFTHAFLQVCCMPILQEHHHCPALRCSAITTGWPPQPSHMPSSRYVVC